MIVMSCQAFDLAVLSFIHSYYIMPVMDTNSESENTVVTLKLTRKQVKALRQIAADWGLIVERGTGTGLGNINKLATKLASGELIVVSQQPKAYT